MGTLGEGLGGACGPGKIALLFRVVLGANSLAAKKAPGKTSHSNFLGEELRFRVFTLLSNRWLQGEWFHRAYRGSYCTDLAAGLRRNQLGRSAQGTS